MNKNILWGFFLMLSFIIGCEDDNDPFSGDDNFITSFTRAIKFLSRLFGVIRFY